MAKRLDESWKGWLRENIGRGCNTEELVGILLKNGFSLASIRENMGVSFPEHSSTARAAQAPSRVDHAALTKVRLTQHATRFPSERAQLYTLPGFLSGAECDEIVTLINAHLRPSTVTISSEDSAYRTSRTSDLSLLRSPVVERLDRKIASALGVRVAYSEGIQAQRYDVGQQFKRHTDYFEPGTDEYQEHARLRGNRTWTFMVYLNDVERGGATRFFALDHTFLPEKGFALAWNNLHEDGTVNPDTLHAGLPVEAGVKIIITKWFRECGTGAMFEE